MRLPGGGEHEAVVPPGWDEPAAFRAWLREWTAAHPTAVLPELWRRYAPVGAAPGAAAPAVPHIPGRQGPTVQGGAPTPEHAVLAAQLAGESTLRAAVPLRAALAGYLEAVRDGWHPPSGRPRVAGAERKLRAHLELVLRDAGWTSTDELGGAAAHRWVQGRQAAGWKNSTIAILRGELRVFAAWCDGQGYSNARPWSWPRYTRKHRKRVATCTLGDVDALIAAAPRYVTSGAAPRAPLRAVWLLMRHHGLRREGIARLPRAAFLLDVMIPHLCIEPYTDKEGDAREVPLAPPVLAELRELFTERAYAPADLPFGRRRADGSVCKRPCDETMRRAARRAGLPKNHDGTEGCHRIRKAHFAAVLDAPMTQPGTAAASYRMVRERTGVTSYTIDTYAGKVSLAEHARAVQAAPCGSPPVQLTFAWRRDGLHGTLDTEGAGARGMRIAPGSEIERRVLQLVRDVDAAGQAAAPAAAVPVPVAGVAPPARGTGRREHPAGRVWTRTARKVLAPKPRPG